MKPTYPYLTNARGHQMDHREIKAALGLFTVDPERPYRDVKIAADVEVDWTTIDGVEVAYMTSADAKVFWGKHPHSRMAMRAIAQCPDCQRPVAASRINQHARVHHGGVRKGY